jgi:hypothetical protein
MKIQFADRFNKSLKRLIWHQHPVYKIYETFRYKIPIFFKNLWFFRKELWDFRSWDYGFNLMMLRRSLEKTVNTIEVYGNEVEESRMKKVEKMKRVIELLKNVRSDSYIEMAEKELGEIKHIDWEFEEVPDKPGYMKLVDKEDDEEKDHNRKVYKRANEIELEEWREIWRILEGQDHNEYVKLMESTSEEDKQKTDLWYIWFDGSGMKNWWD